MELSGAHSTVKAFFSRYKYALIVLLAGAALMLFPTGSRQESGDVVLPVETTSLEEELQSALSCIDGAGEVRVLLTQSRGRQTVYQTDTDSNTDSEKSTNQSRTVIVTDSERNELGLVQRTDPPVYQGAVIVCQGADSAQVRLAVVDAVRCATGLSSHQISVLKMK